MREATICVGLACVVTGLVALTVALVNWWAVPIWIVLMWCGIAWAEERR